MGVTIENATGTSLNDVIAGGPGDERLTGGGGNDTFVFAAFGNGNDRITDFGITNAIQIAGTSLSGPIGVGNGPTVALNRMLETSPSTTTTTSSTSKERPRATARAGPAAQALRHERQPGGHQR